MTRRSIASPRETTIERRVADDARNNLGIKNIKLGGPRTGTNGYPDRIFFLPGGRPVMIEFKRPGEPPRILQEHQQEELRKLDYDVVSFDDYDEAMEYLRKRKYGGARL